MVVHFGTTYRSRKSRSAREIAWASNLEVSFVFDLAILYPISELLVGWICVVGQVRRNNFEQGCQSVDKREVASLPP